MKFLFIIVFTNFSIQSYAGQNNEDLSKLLHEAKSCPPHRDNQGNYSYNCNDESDEKTNEGKSQKLGTKKVDEYQLQDGGAITQVNGESVDSPAKAMELYNSLKSSKKITMQRSLTLDDKIKSCLVDLYQGQLIFHKSNGVYSNSPSDFGINKNVNCNDFDISVDLPTQNEFKIVARTDNYAWTIDQTKAIVKIK